MKNFAIVLLVFYCCMGSANAEIPGKPDSLTAFVQWMELEAGGSYGTIMASRKHPEGRLAPEVFRDYISEMEPQRIHFCQGVEWAPDLVTFWWSMEECAIKSSIDTVLEQTAFFFKQREYIPVTGIPENEFKVELTEGTRTYSFRLWDFTKYPDSKLCGGKIRLSVRFFSSIEAPRVGETLKIYPALNAPEFPVSLMKILKSKTFSSLSYGGTWDRNYLWSLEIPCQTEENLLELRKVLIKAILDYGFLFHSESEGVAAFKLHFADNTSFIYLSPEADEVLKIMFRANS